MREPSGRSYSASVDVHPDCYNVDDLLIEVDRRRVSRHGHEIRLGRLTFGVLVVLVRGAPEVISTAALMQQLWGDAAVDRETVTQRVIALRTALGDDAKKVRYIENVRGSGYRIVAVVTSFMREERGTGPLRLRAVLRSK